MNPPKVFCSHRSVDKGRVEPIARALRAAGIDAWLDTWEIRPGDSIVEKINTALEQCDIALIFFSATTLESAWVGEEANALTHQRITEGKRLIPVLLHPEAPVPPLLRHLSRVRGDAVDELIAAVWDLSTGKPPLGPPPVQARERTFRVVLRTAQPGELAVLAEQDGSPVAPEQTGRLGPAFEFSYQDFLRSRVPQARKSGPSAARTAELARLGEAVGQAVFPAAVGTALTGLLAEARSRHQTVTLSFETAEPKLLSIPFEAARLPDGRIVSLEPGTRVVRRHAKATAGAIEPLPGPLSILVAIGAPDEGKTPNTVLDVEQELQTLLDAADRARNLGGARPDIQVEILEVGHPDQILKALTARPYHVLHLSGHGTSGSMEMETEEGDPVSMSPTQLADALRDAGRPVPLVVLASCLSGIGDTETAGFAQGLLEHGFPMVVAMQASVSDWYATRLAGSFYGHLATTPLASHALALARHEVENERHKMEAQGETRLVPEYATPSLFLAGVERPVFDSRLPPVAPAHTSAPAVTGPVPLLDIGDLIGRRAELRRVLRTLRADPRAVVEDGNKVGIVLRGLGGVGKSALAGRAMSLLAREGWHLAAVEGRWTLGELATKVGAALLTNKNPDVAGLAGHLLHPNLPDDARLDVLSQLLGGYSLLLVLDNFEDNLTLGGTAFLDVSTGLVLGALYQAARKGKLLVTSRYPIPDSEAWLATLDLGPLSAAQARKLFYRLSELKDQPPEVLNRLLRLLGGHPRLVEYLDAILRRGKGRLPSVEARLRENVQALGLKVDDLGGSLEKAIEDAILVGAQDIFLNELLAIVERDTGDHAVLTQAAVFPSPVDVVSLAYALNEASEPSEDNVRDVGDAARRLVRTSLLTPIGAEHVFVHRWTAQALQKKDGAAYREACRRAGECYWWRVRNGKAAAGDSLEAARLFYQAQAYERGSELAWPLLNLMNQFGQVVAALSFCEEILAALPESHDEYPLFLRESADALVKLGGSQGAWERYHHALELDEQKVAREPNRADYQRDLSVSYNKLGALLRSLGQGEAARQYYEKDLAIAERLAREEPNRADYQRDLSVSYNKLGDLLRSLGQGEAARQYYEKDLAIAERLAREEPNRADYQRDLSVSYERMGDLLRSLGQGEAARQFYEQALALSERLAREEPNRADYQRDLSVSYNKLGDLLRDLGQGEAARESYEKDLAIADRLAREEPNRADYQWDLAVSLMRVPSYDAAAGPAALRRALDILKILKARGALLPTQEPWIAELERRLAEIPGESE